jgi:hypothetical protein
MSFVSDILTPTFLEGKKKEGNAVHSRYCPEKKKMATKKPGGDIDGKQSSRQQSACLDDQA